MSNILISLAILLATPVKDAGGEWDSATTATAVSGDAAFYRHGLMAQVAVNKGYIGSTSEYRDWLSKSGFVGAVASYRKQDAGRSVYIVWPDNTLDGPYIIIDVVAEDDWDLGMDRGRVLDVSYKVAEEHGAHMRPTPVIVIYDIEKLFEIARSAYPDFNTGYEPK